MNSTPTSSSQWIADGASDVSTRTSPGSAVSCELRMTSSAWISGVSSSPRRPGPHLAPSRSYRPAASSSSRARRGHPRALRKRRPQGPMPHCRSRARRRRRRFARAGMLPDRLIPVIINRYSSTADFGARYTRRGGHPGRDRIPELHHRGAGGHARRGRGADDEPKHRRSRHQGFRPADRDLDRASMPRAMAARSTRAMHGSANG